MTRKDPVLAMLSKLGNLSLSAVQTCGCCCSGWRSLWIIKDNAAKTNTRYVRSRTTTSVFLKLIRIRTFHHLHLNRIYLMDMAQTDEQEVLSESSRCLCYFVVKYE